MVRFTVSFQCILFQYDDDNDNGEDNDGDNGGDNGEVSSLKERRRLASAVEELEARGATQVIFITIIIIINQ